MAVEKWFYDLIDKKEAVEKWVDHNFGAGAITCLDWRFVRSWKVFS